MAGKRRTTAVDFAVGFSRLKKTGEQVEYGEPLMFIHARSAADVASILPLLDKAVQIS